MNIRGSKILALGAVLITSFGLWSSAFADSFPEVIPLPVGFYPEAIPPMWAR